MMRSNRQKKNILKKDPECSVRQGAQLGDQGAVSAAPDSFAIKGHSWKIYPLYSVAPDSWTGSVARNTFTAQLPGAELTRESIPVPLLPSCLALSSPRASLPVPSIPSCLASPRASLPVIH